MGFTPALAARFADAHLAHDGVDITAASAGVVPRGGPLRHLLAAVVIAVVRERGLRRLQQAGRDESGYYLVNIIVLLASPGSDVDRRGGTTEERK